MSAELTAAMATARVLIDLGVPLFVARPDLAINGGWRAEGGHNKTGFWFPDGWPTTVCSYDVLDRWQPGDALCAVTGVRLDVLDVDPRNGGSASAPSARRDGPRAARLRPSCHSQRRES